MEGRNKVSNSKGYKINIRDPLTERERKYREKYGEEALRRMKALGAAMF